MRTLWAFSFDELRMTAYRLWATIPSRCCDLGIEIAIALVTGFYSGAIVARMARFSALKNEALRLARAIDYGPSRASAQPSSTCERSIRTNIIRSLLFGT